MGCRLSSAIPVGAKEAPAAHHVLDTGLALAGKPGRGGQGKPSTALGSHGFMGVALERGLSYILQDPSRWAVQGASSVELSETRCPCSLLRHLWGLVLSPWARPAHPQMSTCQPWGQSQSRGHLWVHMSALRTP